MGTTLLGEYGKALGRAWWVLLLFGLISAGFGIMAIARPVATATALTWVFGLYALADALIGIFGLFDKNNGMAKGWLLLYIVVSAAFGILALTDPISMTGSIIFMLAIWLVIAGIFRVVWAIRIRKAISNEWLLALSGLLMVLLGVLMALYPVVGIAVTTIWVGVIALVYGVFQIFAAFKLRKLATG